MILTPNSRWSLVASRWSATCHLPLATFYLQHIDIHLYVYYIDNHLFVKTLLHLPDALLHCLPIVRTLYNLLIPLESTT
jgi:uncharacterized membrane protein